MFYLGHAKFPDRMASWTARVRKPIYKHSGNTDAIQARRFVDRRKSQILPATDVHASRRKRSEKRALCVNVVPTIFFSFNYDKCRVQLPVTQVSSDPKKPDRGGENATDQPQFLQF